MTLDGHDAVSGSGDGRARSLVWVSAAFYVLIAFEFFYMASPFAAYFYAVYGPGMDGLEASGFADWTLWFFLPHIVADTRSPLVNHAGAIGAVLFLGGLVVFAIGAFRVYRAKLLGRGTVTGGSYAVIRHPQYAALIVASLGMLLIWPRFLVLFATVVVVFTYGLLARAEESICSRRFPDYAAYRERTGMFVPRSWTAWLSGSHVGSISRQARIPFWIAAFCLVLVAATAIAFGVRHLAIASLYTSSCSANRTTITRSLSDHRSGRARCVKRRPGRGGRRVAGERWDGRIEFRLGRSVSEAHRTWGAQLEAIEAGEVRTVPKLVVAFKKHHLPTVSPKTRESYLIALGRIEAAFVEYALGEIEQADAQAFYDALAKQSRSVARSSAGVLKTLVSFAAKRRDVPTVRTNPLLGMRCGGGGGRYVTDEEIGAVLAMPATLPKASKPHRARARTRKGSCARP